MTRQALSLRGADRTAAEAKRDGERSNSCVPVRPNVRAKATVEADADWPRKDNLPQGLERPGGGCRSGSPLERGVRPHCVRSEPARGGWRLP